MRKISKILSGRLVIGRGTAGDYAELERFHYLPVRPATWAGIWAVRFVPHAKDARERDLRDQLRRRRRRRRDRRHDRRHDHRCRRRQLRSATLDPRHADARTVAVAVLSYPSPSCLPRRRALRLRCSRSDELAFANRHVRTISRVIVHPQFRSLGLAAALVRRVCRECRARYIEAIAVMGRANPFFERGGMRRIEDDRATEAVYYLYRRRRRSCRSRRRTKTRSRSRAGSCRRA